MSCEESKAALEEQCAFTFYRSYVVRQVSRRYGFHENRVGKRVREDGLHHAHFGPGDKIHMTETMLKSSCSASMTPRRFQELATSGETKSNSGLWNVSSAGT